ncbi:helix-hairpin-helix domain-containing protein [Clostridium sp. cel8]|jgi:competence protein ComEA|uniref:helix-hairpin-helix domain-containing protein n=1 Tax=unclassified Clostridium TaxID=2614128 RepID=UPI0015F4CD6E|nr:helix-hairpin-helix domain-containing protein [Clostridium sp. cel8]MBA5849906.1 helix-hairpin-helix domain-containing protein [Clostridium sp. cel8]
MSIIDKVYVWIEKNKNSKYKKKIIGSLVIIILFTIFLIIGYINSRPINISNSSDIFNEKYEDSENKDAQGGLKSNSESISVYINGEVEKPGVYKLKNDSRIEDLIKVSGGFKDDADTYKINLAKKLKDEDYIYVDKIQNVDQSQKTAAYSESGVNEDGTVNINTASKEELKSIPGVGDVTAQKIIDYREENGGFSSVEDIKNVDRIGDKTFEKMKSKIDVR